MFNFSVFGGTNVKGRYKPDAHNTYAMLAGGVEIDLRQAELPDTPIKLTIYALFGGAKVIVPPGTSVDVGGVVILGGKKTNVDPGTEPSRAHVKIWFNCLAGGLEVTSRGG